MTLARLASRWCLALLVMLPMAGCVVQDRGGGGGGARNESGGGARNDEGGGTSEEEATGTLSVRNDCDQPISYVHISSVDDPSWNGDQLGNEVIGSGESFSWTAPVGRYHIRCDLADGQSIDTLEEYRVTSGGTTTCVVSQGD